MSTSLDDLLEKILPLDLRWNDLGEYISKDEASLFYFYDFELDKSTVRKTGFRKKTKKYNKEDVIRQRIFRNKEISRIIISHQYTNYKGGDISLDIIERWASLNEMERNFVEEFYCGRGEKGEKLIDMKKVNLCYLLESLELQNYYLDRLMKGYKLKQPEIETKNLIKTKSIYESAKELSDEINLPAKYVLKCLRNGELIEKRSGFDKEQINRAILKYYQDLDEKLLTKSCQYGSKIDKKILEHIDFPFTIFGMTENSPIGMAEIRLKVIKKIEEYEQIAIPEKIDSLTFEWDKHSLYQKDYLHPEKDFDAISSLGYSISDLAKVVKLKRKGFKTKDVINVRKKRNHEISYNISFMGYCEEKEISSFDHMVSFYRLTKAETEFLKRHYRNEGRYDDHGELNGVYAERVGYMFKNFDVELNEIIDLLNSKQYRNICPIEKKAKFVSEEKVIYEDSGRHISKTKFVCNAVLNSVVYWFLDRTIGRFING